MEDLGRHKTQTSNRAAMRSSTETHENTSTKENSSSSSASCLDDPFRTIVRRNVMKEDELLRAEFSSHIAKNSEFAARSSAAIAPPSREVGVSSTADPNRDVLRLFQRLREIEKERSLLNTEESRIHKQLAHIYVSAIAKRDAPGE